MNSDRRQPVTAVWGTENRVRKLETTGTTNISGTFPGSMPQVAATTPRTHGNYSRSQFNTSGKQDQQKKPEK